MKEHALIFDYDGTLTDTVPVKVESYARATIQVFGAHPSQRPLIRQTQLRFGGAPKRVQLAETLRALQIEATAEQVEAWCQQYSGYNDRYTPQCPEFPAARHVLERLAPLHDLYLASGLPDAELKADAARRDLATYFLEVQGGDKAAYCRAFRRRGYVRVTFLGDGQYDEQVATASGFRFISIESNDDLLKALATLTAGDGGASRPAAPWTQP